MRLVPLRSVEFLQGVRGPGSRRDGDVTATHQTEKIAPGTTEIAPTGLLLLWDRGAKAIYMLRPESKEYPAVVVGQHLVHRMVPLSFEWINDMAEADAADRRKGK